MSTLASIATNPLRWELAARERVSPSRHRAEVPGLEGHSTGDIRAELRRREKAWPRGGDGRKLVPIRHENGGWMGRRWTIEGIVEGRYRSDETDANVPTCVWCWKVMPTAGEDPICYPCRLREHADRLAATGQRKAARRALERAHEIDVRRPYLAVVVDEDDAT